MDGDDSVPVKDMLRDQDVLHVIQYRMCHPNTHAHVICHELKREVHGTEEGDTVLSVKLRAQDQLGLPARHVTVMKVGCPYAGSIEHTITAKDKYYIEVSQ